MKLVIDDRTQLQIVRAGSRGQQTTRAYIAALRARSRTRGCHLRCQYTLTPEQVVLRERARERERLRRAMLHRAHGQQATRRRSECSSGGAARPIWQLGIPAFKGALELELCAVIASLCDGALAHAWRPRLSRLPLLARSADAVDISRVAPGLSHVELR